MVKSITTLGKRMPRGIRWALLGIALVLNMAALVAAYCVSSLEAIQHLWPAYLLVGLLFAAWALRRYPDTGRQGMLKLLRMTVLVFLWLAFAGSAWIMWRYEHTQHQSYLDYLDIGRLPLT